jgi:hypothetical protein
MIYSNKNDYYLNLIQNSYDSNKKINKIKKLINNIQEPNIKKFFNKKLNAILNKKKSGGSLNNKLIKFSKSVMNNPYLKTINNNIDNNINNFQNVLKTQNNTTDSTDTINTTESLFSKSINYLIPSNNNSQNNNLFLKKGGGDDDKDDYSSDTYSDIDSDDHTDDEQTYVEQNDVEQTDVEQEQNNSNEKDTKKSQLNNVNTTSTDDITNDTDTNNTKTEKQPIFQGSGKNVSYPSELQFLPSNLSNLTKKNTNDFKYHIQNLQDKLDLVKDSDKNYKIFINKKNNELKQKNDKIDEIINENTNKNYISIISTIYTILGTLATKSYDLFIKLIKLFGNIISYITELFFDIINSKFAENVWYIIFAIIAFGVFILLVLFGLSSVGLVSIDIKPFLYSNKSKKQNTPGETSTSDSSDELPEESEDEKSSKKSSAKASNYNFSLSNFFENPFNFGVQTFQKCTDIVYETKQNYQNGFKELAEKTFEDISSEDMYRTENRILDTEGGRIGFDNSRSMEFIQYNYFKNPKTFNNESFNNKKAINIFKPKQISLDLNNEKLIFEFNDKDKYELDENNLFFNGKKLEKNCNS